MKNIFEETHDKLNRLLKEMVINQTTSELWKKVFTAKEWDDNYLYLVKEELKKRVADNKN